MVAVDWDRIGPAKAEDIISMLLKNLYPDAERIWGAGGDEGRDVQIRQADGSLHAFEIKGFTGRITRSRRQQITRSLRRAAQLNPTAWTLLMPIDPTPGEEQWLRSLQQLVAFPSKWYGRLFVDTELAKRPWIERYLLGDAAREVVRLLEQVGQEKAALGQGMPDAIERIERVASELNELDPFYVWQITSDGGHTIISPRPRYRGAEFESPLEIEIQFRFSDNQEGRQAAQELRQHLDFGTPLEVPPQYIDKVKINSPVFPAELPSGGHITATSRIGRSVDFDFTVSSPDGEIKALVPISGKIVTSGQRGSIVELADASGCLTVRLTVDVVDRKLTINFRYHIEQPYYPAQLRPVVALMAELTPPNQLEIRSRDGQRWSQQTVETAIGIGNDRHFLRLLDDLALIQWAAGRSETIGPDFSKQDLKEIWVAGQLVRGEQLTGTWHDATFTVADDVSPETRRLWTKDGFRLRISTAEPYVAQIAGREYPLGQGVVWEVDSATMASEHDGWRKDGPPAGFRVRLIPKDSNVIKRWLLTEDAVRLRARGEIHEGSKE